MEIPSQLNKYLPKAKVLLTKSKDKDILFLDGSYEVEIIDGKNIFWPFLQIDDEGNIQDVMCSCIEQEKSDFCEHITTAYLKIFNKEKEPLHIRFEHSFYKNILQIIAKGLDPKLGGLENGNYIFNRNNENIFEIKIKDSKLRNKIKKKIKEISEKLESSVKFSFLSFEDIAAYKANKISDKLKFELSIFSDIAKELFFLQEKGEPYKVEFLHVKESTIFNSVKISFKDICIQIHVEEKDLAIIIPTLKNIKSSLKIFSFEEDAIKKISYDKKNQQFNIEIKKDVAVKFTHLEKEKYITIGKWKYISNKGFLPQIKSPFLEKNIITTDEIPFFLTNYRSLFEKHLSNENISYKSIDPKHYFFIDEEENLHIRMYMFDENDLYKEKSIFFNPWIYVEDKGFFIFKNLNFDTKEKIISKGKVSEFINHNKSWLQSIKGFETHLGSFQENLIYFFDEKQNLVFDTDIMLPKGMQRVINYDQWVYIEKKGFYSKKEKASFPISPKTIVSKDNIEEFLLNKKKDLMQLSAFFLKENPIKKIGVKIELNEKKQIEIIPHTILNEGYSFSDIVFFNKFIYVKNKGFFELPYNYKLPKNYEKKKTIILTSKGVVSDYFKTDQKEEVLEERSFIEYELKGLKPFIISIDHRLKAPKKLKVKIEEIKKDRKNYLVDLSYISEFGEVKASDLYFEFTKNKKYIFSEVGLLDAQDFRFNWLKEINKKKVLIKKQMLRLNILQWLRLCIFENITKPRATDRKTRRIIKIFDELNKFKTDIPIDITRLKATLRPYQEKGVKWLWFLYCYGLSGLLCDDMGLGKTHQAMALLAAVSLQEEKKKYIVVCPTSVIYHWDELIKQFLPDLKVCVFHGIERELLDEYDVLITSYGLIRSENKLLSKINFEICVFDEIQIAKNYASKTYKALKKIKGKMLVGLTGTPIENRIKELESIFNLILPNYLPTESIFQQLFIIPIEKEGNKKQKKMLSNLIKPFILRRKKQQVLLDLPAKVENISYCDLLQDQNKLYLGMINRAKREVFKDLKDKNKSINYMHIFAIFSKLKQICDHPVLINKDIENYKKYRSGKWELFIELLKEARESSQKVVVFSQYLSMIAIMRKYLEENNISYASIIGSTVKRQEEIKRFKQEPKCEVFLASLLAAGVGIDLSCASIVIHYDRWWNPAKENQATDRVHRIGQSRGVQVFKLVTKNTIEERIHSIIERKKNLIEEMIGKDDSEQIKVLSREELISIFQEMSS